MFELHMGKFADEWTKLHDECAKNFENKYKDERDRLNNLPDEKLDELMTKEYDDYLKKHGSKEFWKFYQEKKKKKIPHKEGIIID